LISYRSELKLDNIRESRKSNGRKSLHD